MAYKPIPPPMPIEQRAKQFAPFSALSGLGRALSEIEEVRVDQIERSEEMQQRIDRLLHRLDCGIPVTVIYYDPIGRQYKTVCDHFSKIDTVRGILHLENGQIPLSRLYDLIPHPLG